jgi:hypothetical protein
MTTTPRNQTHLAELLGISKSVVCEQAARGMPVLSLEAAQVWRRMNIDPARKKGKRYDQHHQPEVLAEAVSDSNESFDSARKREKIAEANVAEIREGLLRGEFLRKDEIERDLFTAGRMLRDTLTNCARRIGAEVFRLDQVDACEQVIDRELRIALASFSAQLRQTLAVDIDNPVNLPIEGKL